MSFKISTNPKLSASWDTINYPQTYSNRPVAAAYVRDSYYKNAPKKSSILSKVAKVFVGAVVVASGLAVCRKKVTAIKDININNPEIYKSFCEKTKYYIAKSGQLVLDQAVKLKFWSKK